jgi:hypothetical protein
MELFERLSGQGFVVSTRIRGVQYLLNRTALIIPSRTAKHSVCRRLRTVLVTCVAGALGFALPPVAVARGDEIGLGACTPSALSQPFARWADWFSYESAPGGDFERSTRWTLSGGARTVSGGEPFAAAGTVGSFSLLLPGGAVAESPSFCVDAAYPTIRFFIAGGGAVAVQVVSGSAIIPAGVAFGAGGWLPTTVMLTGSAVTGALAGGTAQVSVKLTALSGHPQVDGVFVDPWNRG